VALKDSKHLHRVGYIQFHPVLLELFEVTAKKPTNQKKKKKTTPKKLPLQNYRGSSLNYSRNVRKGEG